MVRSLALIAVVCVWCCSALFFLLETTSSFSVIPSSSSPRRTTKLYQSSSTRVNGQAAAKAAARAGEDGYSVLRQPAKWDIDKDPVFDVPESLDASKGDITSRQQLDDEWWSMSRNSRSNNINNNKQVSSAVPTKISSISREEVPAEEELDLLQRSVDTLDYPRVLNALYQECTTVPAKRLVREATRVTSRTTSLNGSGSSSKRSKIPKSAERAYQPLTADTVQGSQERYRAVQEMEWLLNGGNRTFPIGQSEQEEYYTYRNRLNYKETLIGRPPPFAAGHGFNLDAILDLAATQAKVLEGPELLEVSAMLDTLENVRLWNDEGLQKARPPEHLEFEQLSAVASCITVNATLQDLLHNAFDDDNDGRLSGTTFPTIGRLRARVRSLKADIMATLDGLLATPSIQAKLALESGGAVYSEVSGGRLVIPVDKKYASAVGIVHDTSRSGKTVFVEPNEIIGSTNELRQTEGELRAEEARVWRSLTEQILVNRVDLETSVNAVGQLDLVLARVLLGRQLRGTVPVVEDEGVIALRNAQHPVLLLRGVENVVGSDVSLGAGKNQGLVLTGPNAGGKTVILKLLGLLALMARAGIPVPAQSAAVDCRNDEKSDNAPYQPRVDFFNPVLADIGDLQSVGGDLSTFSGHMLVCREVLTNSGRNALVLMDELGSGTDPNQGVAIAQALLEAVIELGARVAITTHYIQLKQLAASDDRFSVASMQFYNGRPTYKLLPGTVGESFALAVAERLGLPQSVLDRANTLLDSETRQMGDLIRELEDQKVLVDQQAEALERKRKEMASMELKMKEERIRLEKKQLGARREEARRFAQKLEEKESVLADVLEKLKSDPSRRVVAKSWDDIRFVKRDALNEAENVPSVLAQKQKVAAAMDEVSAELVPIAEMRDKPDLNGGDTLIVCKQGPLFGREATVVKTMGSRVEVKVNSMTVVLKLTQVAMPTGKRIMLPTSVGGGAGTEQKKPVSRKQARSKAAEQAIAAEGKAKSSNTRAGNVGAEKPASAGTTMRTQSNTVDVRGCNLSEAQEKIKDKFSTSLMSGRPVVYILHGHGTGGVLKTKIRGWLRSEKLAKKFAAADLSDGGDAFTRVELR